MSRLPGFTAELVTSVNCSPSARKLRLPEVQLDYIEPQRGELCILSCGSRQVCFGLRLIDWWGKYCSRSRRSGFSMCRRFFPLVHSGLV